MIKVFDIVMSREKINENVPQFTRGVVLDISSDRTFFVIEFVDEKDNSLDGGATIVRNDQIYLAENNKSNK